MDKRSERKDVVEQRRQPQNRNERRPSGEDPMELDQIVCYKCGGRGHKKVESLSRKKKQVNTVEQCEDTEEEQEVNLQSMTMELKNA